MVLLVNQLTIPVFVDIANAIAQKGKPVTLFTGKVEKCNKSLLSNIHVVKSIAYMRSSLFNRLLSWMLFTFHLGAYLLFKRGINHILVVTNPPIGPIVVSMIAKWRRIPYSVLVYDLYPEALAQAGVSSELHWIFKIWKKINPLVFNPASSVITLSKSMQIAIAPYLHISESIRIIPNWVDNSYIRPILKVENPFLVKYGLLDKLVVLYSGNMGMTHDLESLIDAAALMKDNCDVYFVMIGDGAKRGKLLAMMEEANLQNILFLPYQSTDDFPFSMAAADIGVITLGTGGEGISVPSKTYVNMAAGLCLLTIAPFGSELNRIVETYECGHICKPNHPEEIVLFLKEMQKDREQLLRYQKNARNASFHFGSEQANLYVDVVECQL
jgi:glycosyltransferase involved in cell wall biosynthesis